MVDSIDHNFNLKIVLGRMEAFDFINALWFSVPAKYIKGYKALQSGLVMHYKSTYV